MLNDIPKFEDVEQVIMGLHWLIDNIDYLDDEAVKIVKQLLMYRLDVINAKAIKQ